jgi:3-oxoadipate enol-lactonase/4-carboxymuconolactone decarboxylase
MPFVTHEGCRLYWRLEGRADKPVILLLHAIGTDMSLWDRMMPHLLARHQVLRMDLRGHGASDVPAGDYSMGLLAGDARAVMDAADVQKAAVCGLSLGGMVAMTLALGAPARVGALILACTSCAMDGRIWQERLATLRARGMAGLVEEILPRFFSAKFRRTHPEYVESVRRGLLAVNPDGYAGCGAAIRDIALLGRLAGLAVPTLVIAGSVDIATPFEGHGDRLVAAIAGARATILAAAHLAAIEAPSDFAAAVCHFLDAMSAHASRTPHAAGLARRREVLGGAWVDQALARRTPFNAEFQEMITRHAWNDIWNRPGLEDRTRRLLVLAITAAQGRCEEFSLHVRSGLEQGDFSENELKETLLQLGVYAGLPAANTAFKEAGEILAQQGAAKNPDTQQ